MGYKIRGPEDKQKQILTEVQTTSGYIRRQTWTHPAAKSATAIHAAITLLATAQNVITGIAAIDFPRVLTIKGVKAGATLTGNVVLTGTDIRGKVVTDTIALNDDAEVAGVVAFKTLTKIALPVRVTAADTVSIGRADNLGLDRCMKGDETVSYTVDGAKEAQLPTVVANATDVSKNTALFNTALANTKVYALGFVTCEKTSAVGTTA